MNNDKRIHTIQYLRGLSALAVVLCHYGQSLEWHEGLATQLTTGQVGIYTFFLISGFVIIYSLKYSGYTVNNFFSFLLKRSARIDPPYITVLLLFLAVFYILSLIPSFNGKPIPFIPGQFLAHVFYLVPFTSFKFYDHVFWTLTVEFQFYLLVGLLFFISRNINYQRSFIFLFAASCFLPYSHGYYFLFTYSPSFATGMSLMLYYTNRKLADFGLLVWSLLTTYLHDGGEIAGILAATSLVILFVTRKSRILNFLGQISYSLYITHTLILILLNGSIKKAVNITISNEIYILLFKVIIAIGVAYLFFIVIEKPSIQLSKKIKLKRDG